MNRKKIIRYLLGLPIIFILFFISIDIFILSKPYKDVNNPEQLKNTLLKNIVNELEVKDSLFLSTRREYRICGNDARFEKKFFMFRILNEMINFKYIYTLDLSNKENKYIIDGNEIVIGHIDINDHFIANKFNFELVKDSLPTQRYVMEIKFNSIKKDTVHISFQNPYELINNEKLVEMSFYNINSDWKRVKTD